MIVLAADLMDIFKIQLIFYDNDVIKYILEVENPPNIGLLISHLTGTIKIVYTDTTSFFLHGSDSSVH